MSDLLGNYLIQGFGDSSGYGGGLEGLGGVNAGVPHNRNVRWAPRGLGRTIYPKATRTVERRGVFKIVGDHGHVAEEVEELVRASLYTHSQVAMGEVKSQRMIEKSVISAALSHTASGGRVKLIKVNLPCYDNMHTNTLKTEACKKCNLIEKLHLSIQK